MSNYVGFGSVVEYESLESTLEEVAGDLGMGFESREIWGDQQTCKGRIRPDSLLRVQFYFSRYGFNLFGAHVISKVFAPGIFVDRGIRNGYALPGTVDNYFKRVKEKLDV